jgi:uncharacterized SAM-binding protein YcdF (DUF218 family)
VKSRGAGIRKFLICLAVLALVVSLSKDIWLRAAGRFLIYSEAIEPAQAAVVLAGDTTGCRLTAAAELARRGVVPLVLVSGPPGIYGINEADAAIRFITAHGYDERWFIPLRHDANSTRAESGYLLAELQRRGVEKFVLVTSNYHSGRAHRIFRQAIAQRGLKMEMRVLASGDPNYTADSWWRSREGRKTAFYEWTKTVTSAVGL